MSKVVRVVELELADGVEADRFERFALDEYLPAVASLGVTVTLLRGNWGVRDRGFLLLEEFESVELPAARRQPGLNPTVLLTPTQRLRVRLP
jgi:hypothetical protein